MEETTPEDLRFKEFAGYTRTALQARGFRMTNDPNKAEVLILLSYGISDPQEHIYSYAQPVYGSTGGSYSTTYGNISGTSGYSTFSGTTYQYPRFGVVGAVPMIGSYVTYTRFVKIEAYDQRQYRTYHAGALLWETNIVSAGASDDLRKVFPIMLAAALPYIGENTGAKVDVVLRDNSKEVERITDPPQAEEI
jgi:hypothetical protein